MIKRLIAFVEDTSSIRSAAAIVAGVLVTVLGHSTIVTAVVDGVAGLVVVVDTAYTAAHKTPAAKTTTTQPT